jgi:hypothetical protein
VKPRVYANENDCQLRHNSPGAAQGDTARLEFYCDAACLREIETGAARLSCFIGSAIYRPVPARPPRVSSISVTTDFTPATEAASRRATLKSSFSQT